jgi:hypothetical protein
MADAVHADLTDFSQNNKGYVDAERAQNANLGSFGVKTISPQKDPSTIVPTYPRGIHYVRLLRRFPQGRPQRNRLRPDEINATKISSRLNPG